MPGHVLTGAIIMGGAGLTCLYLIHLHPAPVIIGFIAVLLYNGLYTPLHSKTMWSILPGTLCGMTPPLIGWVAAGGPISSPAIWFLMILFGLWQPPHSWLLLLIHKEDYQRSKTPNPLTRFSPKFMDRLLYVWIVAFVCAALCLPLVGTLSHGILRWVLVVLLMVLMGLFSQALFRRTEWKNYRRLFHYLNFSIVVILLLIIAS